MLGQLTIVALTIWGESRGEPFAGRMAVASVIHNRALERHQDPVKVCLAESQFSCWNEGQDALLEEFFDEVASSDANASAELWAECLDLARLVLTGELAPSGPWNHFYAARLYPAPAWSANGTAVATIGRHIFLKV